MYMSRPPSSWTTFLRRSSLIAVALLLCLFTVMGPSNAHASRQIISGLLTGDPGSPSAASSGSDLGGGDFKVSDEEASGVPLTIAVDSSNECTSTNLRLSVGGPASVPTLSWWRQYLEVLRYGLLHVIGGGR